jgi:topoisomerase IA-like protein
VRRAPCWSSGTSAGVSWVLGVPEVPEHPSIDTPGELSEDAELGSHPESGQPVYLKSGPYGLYVQLGDAGENGKKPRRSSLPEGTDPDSR